MIKTEIITVNERQFQRTFSDAGFMIERDGFMYSEAVDPLDSGRTYIETNERIDAEQTISGDEFLAMLEEVM